MPLIVSHVEYIGIDTSEVTLLQFKLIVVNVNRELMDSSLLATNFHKGK